MEIATAGLPTPEPVAGLMVAAIIVFAIVSYAVAWWRILEDRPNPFVQWRSPIARRK
jgi:hypothetical protein